MAYQPKSYRKFLVSTVAAAMVATVAAPIAPLSVDAASKFSDVTSGVTAWAGNAIDYLVDAGAIKGYEDGTFKPNNGLTRAEAATVLVAILGLDVPAKPSLTFKDTKNDAWYAGAVQALVDAGIVKGFENGTFQPNTQVTRAQLAQMVVEAYDLEAPADLELEFSDVVSGAWYEDAVQILALNGIVGGFDNGTFQPNATVTRAQAAVFVHRTEVEEARLEVEFPGVSVAGVSAVNGTTLQVNGANLAELKAEDVTVEGNTVESVTASTDGKTATVKLGSPLALDATTKVTVKESSFDVTYKVEVTGVAIVENQTFDDDTANQYVKISVDGKELTPQELITAGYQIEFESFSNRNGTTTTTSLFRTNLADSTTGELSRAITLAGSSNDYYVRVTLTKGSEVMTSSITKVTVKNLDATANSISEATISVKSTTSAVDFDLVSSTLATGDVAKFTELAVAVGGNKEFVDLTGVNSANTISVKSSDESVISVDKSNYELTAEGPGSATITVTYGGATYTKSLTVKSGKREITNVKLDKSTLFVGKGSTNTFKVQAVDQYGDPIEAAGDNAFTVHSSDVAKATENGVGTVSSNGKLEYTVTVTGVDTGTSDFTVRDIGNARIGSAVRVTVGENTSISKYTLTVDSDISDADVNLTGASSKTEVSTDATIDTGDDKYVKINIKAFNSAGQELSSPIAGTDYTVTGVNVSKANVLDTNFGNSTPRGVDATGSSLVAKAGSAAGTVTITITDRNNTSVTQNIRLTVTDNGANVTGVTFKNVEAVTYSTLLNYEDFLSHTKSDAGDPRITGLTLSKSFSQAIRLTTGNQGATTLPNVDALYVDLDGNSLFTAGEPIVGFVGMATTGDVVGATGSVTARTGYTVATGSDGNVIFRLFNNKDEIVASKVVKVDF